MDDIKNIIDEIFYRTKERPSVFEEIKYRVSNIPTLITEGEGAYTGSYGEWLTGYKLDKNLEGYYKIFKNIYIPYGENKTTEIDIVIIHQKGIFVIESKNYSGYIFGSENQKMWTQCLPNKIRKQFYNPIKQNRSHIDLLSKYIKISKYKMMSFIVFSERCKLMKVPENTKEYIVVKRENFTESIVNQLKIRDNLFTEKQVDYISNKLIPISSVSGTIKEQHIENINSKYKA